jgi:DNA-binding XRE family transcriptional regulator|nr:helix-turn-helix transcriptional regulator [Faecalimonas umbilicata]
MTQNEFNVVLEQQYRKCADVLVHKKKEYTGDRIDRLSAFKIAASLQGCTPKTALAGMMSKHVVSLYDMFSIMITFGRKLKHLRQKNHLTQKELGIALGFPEDSADVRIAQYEADARKPRDEILAKMAKILYVPIDVLTVPVLSEPREYDAASFWMHELSAEL